MTPEAEFRRALDAARRTATALDARGQRAGNARDARRLVVGAARLGAEGIVERAEGISRMADIHEREVSSWVPPDRISETGGRFDACDLRHWLRIAEAAGIAAIPATPILVLTEEEADAFSGSMALPGREHGSLGRRFADAVAGARRLLGVADEPVAPAVPALDREMLVERLAAAMDYVPEGWMVRHTRIGPSNLKTIAGMGFSGPEVPGVSFSSGLEIGPGWVREGNRRRVHVSDRRTVMGIAQGPGGDQVFMARPWIPAGRWLIDDDPHRAGTPLQGAGAWPAEWRAFVEDGKVIGVTSYYSWAGGTEPLDARMALAARDLAQKMADAAAAAGAWPSYFEIESAREAVSEDVRSEAARFPREGVSCTLDFMETGEGLMFLEGGPPYTRLGGGHPCGFAGLPRPEGVALRQMPGVLPGDPRSWRETDRTGAILTWDEAETLANGTTPAPRNP